MSDLRALRETSPAIICLLGTSRCGSTLLQRAIALSSGAIALGEIARVHELLERQSLCACGERLATCEFWASALPSLKQTAPIVAWSEARWLERSKMLRGVLATVTGQSFIASPTERESARALALALASLAEQTGSALFIDSSKDPSEFLRLALLPSHLIVPVHLVRDPRGVAWSAFRRTGIDPIAMASHWSRLNRAIAWLKRMTSRYPWQLVRYEDFCRDPLSARRRLLMAAGHKEDIEISATVTHAMGGSSEFSLERNGSIVLDERWKAEMPVELQRHIMQTIGITARKLGYI